MFSATERRDILSFQHIAGSIMGAPNNSTPSVSSTRFPSHQLSNGLYVSGHPDQYKDKTPTMGVSQMPYTGGDVKKSGELGKMFDIPVEISSSAKLRKSGSTSGNPLKVVCSGASTSHSGPLPSLDSTQTAAVQTGLLSSNNSWRSSKSGPSVSKSGPLIGSGLSAFIQSSKSGPLTRGGGGESGGSSSSKNHVPGTGFIASAPALTLSGSVSLNGGKISGPLPPPLPATGLITSGPISSSPLAATGVSRKAQSGPLESSGPPGKPPSAGGSTSQAVNNLSFDEGYSFRRSFPRVILWTVIPLFVMGFIAGAFIIAAVQNAVLLIVVASLFVAVATLLLWNTCWGRKTVTGFLGEYPHSELVSAKDGQYVKVTGVVTCGSVPLESSYLKVNRCIYTSTGLYEYRSLFSKPAKETHHFFTWGVRHMERHVVDFYISDLQSGLRALVKAGFGARLTPHVMESSVVDVTSKSKDLPTEFLRWLSDRNLCTGERPMQLKEGYIKEGSTVTVFGVVQRQENVLMILPPPEAISTGCQWWKCLLPASLDGLIVISNDTIENEGIPL
ncbi:hypothetical protein Mapa_013408 [Marchantia paleacea]|nr:hypothetical protein Mapa_013408 [Marchantia paleacea]